MTKVISINKKLKSAQAMLKECLEEPGITKCIIIIDGDERDAPLYCQHGMSLAEMAYYGALIIKEALT